MASDRSNPDRTLPQTDEDLRRAQERSLRPTKPPMSVPGYQAERFLGAGAYGQVWVAVDGNTGRRVAIKFYNQRGGLDWSLLSREVERLALLFADRYVVQLVDVGWDADPPYYVMEYLEHGSLADRLEHGPLQVKEAIDLFREVAIGLVHAHGKGILHCDLKPANVLLDQDGKPRLADFGQSRLSHEQVPALGTLFYMAPEQADLEAIPDARWDVYALGALLHCMLTGSPPHRDPRLIAQMQESGGLEEQLARYRQWIRSAPNPKLHRTVPGVDRELSDIINRCLNVTAQKRFPNPQAVLDALHARAARRARRPLLVLGAVGPAVLLLVMSAFGWDVFETALGESSDALTQRALESDRFAAQFVAETVGTELDRRWSLLEQIAARPDIRALVISAAGQPNAPARGELQEKLVAIHRQHPLNVLDRWFLLDAHGHQLARSPLYAPTIDRNFSFRDYFHGQGRDLPEESVEVAPITAPHLSIVFMSEATNDRTVALSVPIWSHDEGDPNRTVLGVLGHAVGLGHFAELRPDERSGNDQIAVLIDAKQDFKGKKGAILEHPRLAAWLEKHPGSPADCYLDSRDLDDFEQLRTRRRELLREIQLQRRPITEDEIRATNRFAWFERYHDPLGGDGNERLLAAIEPVVVHGRPEPIRDTGLGIIVQEGHEAAVRPVAQLREGLQRRGMVALGVVLFVVTALWGFVIVVLNESNRFRWLFRRRRSVTKGGPAPGCSEVSPGAPSERSNSQHATTNRADDTRPAPE